MTILLDKFSNGKVIAQNDGNMHQLQEVIKYCFPHDKNIPLGFNPYYFQHEFETTKWTCSHPRYIGDRLVIPVTILYEELLIIKRQTNEAIEFAEWLRTFSSLEKKDGFWVLDSQIASEELYDNFRISKKQKQKEAVENKSEEKKDEIQYKILQVVPYQLCPKCNGQGQVSKPPYIAGDVPEWSSSSVIFQCDVCSGAKVIPMFVVSEVVPTNQTQEQ